MPPVSTEIERRCTPALARLSARGPHVPTPSGSAIPPHIVSNTVSLPQLDAEIGACTTIGADGSTGDGGGGVGEGSGAAR